MAEILTKAHNMLFRLDADQWRHDLDKSDEADLDFYSEAEGAATREVLANHCQARNKGLYHPEDCGNPIAWGKDLFATVNDTRGVVRVHERHPTAKFNPARDFAYIGLRHRVTGTKILAISIHAIAGYAKPEDLTPWGHDLDKWKNWAARQYFLDLVEFTAKKMSSERFDLIIPGGDYNARLDNDQEWYYPGALLKSLYRFDNHGGIDHILLSRGNSANLGRSFTKQGFTDHPIIFQEVTGL